MSHHKVDSPLNNGSLVEDGEGHPLGGQAPLGCRDNQLAMGHLQYRRTRPRNGGSGEAWGLLEGDTHVGISALDDQVRAAGIA